MAKLKGKVVVITGGGSGQGLATAKRFVDEGAFVYITGRRQTELDKAVSLIGRSVVAVQADVSNLADLDRLYARVEDEYELKERAEALTRKLTVIADTAEVLTDIIDTRRSLRLELTIVILIVIEIAFAIYQTLR